VVHATPNLYRTKIESNVKNNFQQQLLFIHKFKKYSFETVSEVSYRGKLSVREGNLGIRVLLVSLQPGDQFRRYEEIRGYGVGSLQGTGHRSCESSFQNQHSFLVKMCKHLGCIHPSIFWSAASTSSIPLFSDFFREKAAR
jgi:hypothetical protein